MSDRDLKEVRPSLLPTVLYTVGCIAFVMATRALIREAVSAALVGYLATALCFAIGVAVHRLRVREERMAAGSWRRENHVAGDAPVQHEPLPQPEESPEMRP